MNEADRRAYASKIVDALDNFDLIEAGSRAEAVTIVVEQLLEIFGDEAPERGRGEGAVICKDCAGTGEQVPGKPCFTCNGTGELCDACGEAINACGCDEDERDERA